MRRDKYGIIIQHNFQQPDDESQYDGGDSISRTAIMALSGSDQDKEIMKRRYFKSNGEIVRHPYYPTWNLYSEMSRDQLVCSAAGFIPEHAEPVRKRHRFMRINKDVLAPDVMWHLALCANHWSKYTWGLIGAPWLILSIAWSAFVEPNVAKIRKKPDHELNQILCQCCKAGDFFLKLLCKWHPDWKKNVNEYWWTGHGTWRDQKPLADLFVQYVSDRISK